MTMFFVKYTILDNEWGKIKPPIKCYVEARDEENISKIIDKYIHKPILIKSVEKQDYYKIDLPVYRYVGL